MSYGTIKVDTITFTDGGVDKSVSVSGFIQNPTITGNISVTGTISGNLIEGQTISGTTVTGNTGVFTTVTGGSAGFTTVTGTTVTGTTANFATLSGTTITGSVGNFGSGSAAAPSVSVGTTDNGIYSPGADQVAISTNGTGRLFVDASGRVGINTGSPSNALQLETNDNSTQGIWLRNTNTGSSAASNVLINSDAGQLVLRAHSAAHSVWPSTATLSTSSGLTGGLALNTGTTAPIAFLTNNSERARIDSSGRLLVGTSSARSNFYNSSYTPRLQLESANNGANSSIALVSAGNGAFNEANLIFAKSRGNAIGDNTIVQSGDDIGNIQFQASDGAEYVAAASILAEVDGTPGANDMPGRLVLSTTKDGQSSPTAAVTIDSSQRLLVGTTTARANFDNTTNGTRLQVEGTDNPSSSISIVQNFNGSTSGARLILGKSNTTSVGSNTIVVADNTIGAVSFQGNDGSEFVQAAEIKAQVDGTPGANDMPGRLVFSTTADGASSLTERLRIDSSGRVGIGTTSPQNSLVVSNAGAYGFEFDPSNGYFQAYNRNTSAYGDLITRSATLQFRIENTERARIDSSGSLLVGTTTLGNNRNGVSISPANVTIANNSGSATLFLSALNTSVASNIGGIITFSAVYRNSDSDSTQIAYIKGLRENATSNNWASYLSFETSPGTAAPVERMRIDSSGRVGVGTTSPGAELHVAGSDPSIYLQPTADTQTSEIAFRNAAGSQTRGFVSYSHTDDALFFRTNLNERARITSSGQLLVGTSSARANLRNSTQTALFQVEGTDNKSRSLIVRNSADDGAPDLYLAKSRGTTVGSNTLVAANDYVGGIIFAGSDGTEFVDAAFIGAQVDGTPGANDMPGRLVFSTTADGASSPTERVRISSTGQTNFYYPTINNYVAFMDATNASYGGTVLGLDCSRAATDDYYFLNCSSGDGGDNEFNLRGGGSGYCDGSWNGGGADYAEYFEWSDSNPDAEDRRGISVVLDGDKIREAQAGEDPIGVISGNPSVVGDAAWNKWSGKYLRDEFGTYIQEDYEVTDDDGNTVIQQRRKLNPAYDPDVEYISREQRPEWDCVGLMGKLRIRKGQVTGSRWIKMRDISDSVEEWLVR